MEFGLSNKLSCLRGVPYLIATGDGGGGLDFLRDYSLFLLLSALRRSRGDGLLLQLLGLDVAFEIFVGRGRARRYGRCR